MWKSLISDFVKDETGLVVVEYIIGAAGVLVIVGLVFATFGNTLVSKVTSVLELL